MKLFLIRNTLQDGLNIWRRINIILFYKPEVIFRILICFLCRPAVSYPVLLRYHKAKVGKINWECIIVQWYTHQLLRKRNCFPCILWVASNNTFRIALNLGYQGCGKTSMSKTTMKGVWLIKIECDTIRLSFLDISTINKLEKVRLGTGKKNGIWTWSTSNEFGYTHCQDPYIYNYFNKFGGGSPLGPFFSTKWPKSFDIHRV